MSSLPRSFSPDPLLQNGDDIRNVIVQVDEELLELLLRRVLSDVAVNFPALDLEFFLVFLCYLNAILADPHVLSGKRVGSMSLRPFLYNLLPSTFKSHQSTFSVAKIILGLEPHPSCL